MELPQRVQLVGRFDDLTRIESALSTVRLLTLVGAPGCGKTSLAVEAARHQQLRYPDGVFFADLTAATTTERVVATVLRALDLHPGPGTTPAALLTEHGRRQRCLLVLDNCEHVLAEARHVVDLLVGSPGELSVLATSREPLLAAAEMVATVLPLSVPDTDVVAEHEFFASSGVQMFVAELPAPPVEGWTPAVREDVVSICRSLDGMPLALQLAAGLCGTFGLAEVRGLVSVDPGRLTAVGTPRSPHHHTVHAAIERSYRQLAPAEALLHRRLAVLPGSFTLAAAHALVVDTEVAEWEVPGLLARLQHRSLLSTRTSPDRATRFLQLATVRGHALHLLRAEQEEPAALEARTQWACGFAARRPFAGDVALSGWLTTVDDDIDGVRAALTQMLGDAPERRGAQLASMLLPYWYYRGDPVEGSRWLGRAVRALRQDRTDDRTIAQCAWITLLVRQGDLGQVRRLAEEMLRDGQVETVTQPSTLVEAMISAATGIGALGEITLMSGFLDRVEPVVLAAADPELDVLLAAGRLIVRSVGQDPAVTAIEAEAVFEEAQRVGNAWASWLVSASGNVAALTSMDVKQGLLWSRRAINHQWALGARVATQQVEALGTFLCAAGALTRGVEALAASQAESRREGVTWPRRPLTVSYLEQARAGMTPDEFDRAWADGPTRRLIELAAD